MPNVTTPNVTALSAPTNLATFDEVILVLLTAITLASLLRALFRPSLGHSAAYLLAVAAVAISALLAAWRSAFLTFDELVLVVLTSASLSSVVLVLLCRFTTARSI